ncbi:MAG: N-acetylmuramoyl-L-alanine amidase [Eubacteriaceae bacterium]|nr:N-acetylmuramoyl-L-alanine amidase [Eubacteriaceae bacterium]
MKKKLLIIIILVIFVWVLPGYRESLDIITSFTPSITMVVDPGHGGQDSGACAGDGTKEKDINLSIAKLFAEEASRYKVNVILTREDDNGLYENQDADNTKWTKTGDMKSRRATMDDAQPQLVVSIHMNSFYADESVHGAQVFYPTNGDPETASKNEELAKTVRETLLAELPDAGERIILPKKDMFIFRDASYEGILIECGFLSNEEDLSNLQKPSYRKKFAAALMKGIAKHYDLEGQECAD